MSVIQFANQCAADIAWVSQFECSFDVTDKIDAWRINISSNLAFLNDCLSVMTPDEIDRSNRYHQVKDRNRFLISRGALRTILGKYLRISPSLLTFGLSKNKKPFITNAIGKGLYYNLSHSGDWILIAVSGYEIGADIEFLNTSFKYRDVLTDNFSAAEIDYINQTSSAERFFLLWTRKEALVKAIGTGLEDDLKSIPSLDGSHFAGEISKIQDWLVNSFKLNEQYIAAIAGSVFIKRTNLWDFIF